MMRVVILAISLAACGHEMELGSEGRAREAYVRALVEREGLLDLWQLSSRGDVILGEGLGALEIDDDGSDEHHAWYDVAPARAAKRAGGRRWMGRRIRIQVRGDGTTDMRLELRGRANLERLFHRPRITVTFDGAEVYSALVSADGTFAIHSDVTHAAQRGWSNVYVILSSIHEPVRAPEILRVAQLEAVVWEPIARGESR